MINAYSHFIQMAGRIITQPFSLLVATFFSLASLCYSQTLPGSDVIAKALICFNKQLIYNKCQESYRLNVEGNLHVPPEATNEFCNGACLEETQLVLNCVDGILTNFIFYNRASIRDMRTTLRAACSYSSRRGNFNVADYIQDYGSANKPDAVGLMTPMVGVTMLCFLLL